MSEVGQGLVFLDGLELDKIQISADPSEVEAKNKKPLNLLIYKIIINKHPSVSLILQFKIFIPCFPKLVALTIVV